MINKAMSTFSDFNTSLAVHPVKKDLSLKTDENAVKQSVKNLILTNKGERLMQPEVGSKIRSLLFENFSPQTVQLCKDYIRETIENFEPRAQIIEINASPDPDNNNLNVGVTFAVINNDNPVTLELSLERIG